VRLECCQIGSVEDVTWTGWRGGLCDKEKHELQHMPVGGEGTRTGKKLAHQPTSSSSTSLQVLHLQRYKGRVLNGQPEKRCGMRLLW